MGVRRSTHFHLIIWLCATYCLSCEVDQARRQPSVQRCVIAVRYQPDHFPTRLEAEVEGRYASLSLLDPNQGPAGLWGADLWVSPGWQSYTLRLEGRSLPDPNTPLSITRQGQLRSLVRVPDCERGSWFRVASERDQHGPRFQLAYRRGLGEEGRLQAANGEDHEGIPLSVNSLQVKVDDRSHSFTRQDELITVTSAGLTQGKHHLTIEGEDEQGQPFALFKAPFWVEATPHSWRRGIMYQVVLDRLSPPIPLQAEDRPTIGERWGGQLDRVSELIESGYLSELGVTTIWLSPLSPNPEGAWQGVEGGEARYEGYHGYWSAAPRIVGEEWGGEDALMQLIQLAHQRGMRVIVDVALNHVHEQHPYVREHPEWFNPPGCLCGRPGCSWGQYIETCQFTTYLPDFRWNGLDAMKRQVDDALWWIDRFNLDGLRVDAVPMMPRRVTRLLSSELQRRFEQLRTRHLLIGETFTGPGEWDRLGWYLGPSGLDGQFDFPLMWAIRAALAWEGQPMWTLMDAWKEGERVWSNAAALMGLFIGNHDVTRFISEAAGDDLSDPWLKPPVQTDDELALDRLWLATAFAFTLPGIPVLYYGDEVGLSGANDPDNRRPYWPLDADRLELLSLPRSQHFERVARLGRLRACLPSFTDNRPTLTFLATDEERLSFLIGQPGQESAVLIQRSANEEESELVLPLSSSEDTSWVDVLSGEVVKDEKVDGELPLTRLFIPPLTDHSVRIFTRRALYEACQETSP